jgi:hypothetical protein
MQARLACASASGTRGRPADSMPAAYWDAVHDPRAAARLGIATQNQASAQRFYGQHAQFRLPLQGRQQMGALAAYDVNPVPDEGTTLKTAIPELHGNALDIEAVINAAPYFDVSEDEAAIIASNMATIIKDEWRALGDQVAMTPPDFKAIAPAMENAQIDKAIAPG